MRVVDANVLIYSVNTAATRHEEARQWLDHALGGQDSVGLTWISLNAFLRIATRPGLFPRPLSLDDALGIVGHWLDAPGAHLLQSRDNHFELLARLLRGAGIGGNLVSDAHLAALALSHQASVVSYDHDFARFSGLRHHTPGELLDGLEASGK